MRPTPAKPKLAAITIDKVEYFLITKFFKPHLNVVDGGIETLVKSLTVSSLDKDTGLLSFTTVPSLSSITLSAYLLAYSLL